LQTFLIVKVFSACSSSITPPKLIRPDSGTMLISGLAPTPFNKQLILLVSVERVNLSSNF
jgi:hypothetical protein